MSDLIVIDARRPALKIAVCVALAAAVAFGWFAVKWQLGDMLASLTQPSDPNASNIADVAVNLAPGDPQAYALKAAAADSDMWPVAAYQTAVRLAPKDFRWHVELGRAYEQDGQLGPAEAEFRQAVDLAPSYAYPRWHLGNFYLRQDRNAEALDQLRSAADNNQTFRDQVFSLVWDVYEKDPAQVEALAGNRPDALSYLAYFFAARARAPESLRNWNRLSDQEKVRHSAAGKAIALSLFQQRFYHESLDLARQLGLARGSLPETVTNGSFEKDLVDDGDFSFGWQDVASEPKLEIATDSRVRHGGERSIRLVFKGFSKPSLLELSQIVAVEPNARYTLRFWTRTENLKAAGGPLVETLNANSSLGLAASTSFSGSSDWQENVIDVTTPANCSGINIRVVRGFCGDVCSITGTLWFDDFDLTRR